MVHLSANQSRTEHPLALFIRMKNWLLIKMIRIKMRLQVQAT